MSSHTVAAALFLIIASYQVVMVAISVRSNRALLAVIYTAACAMWLFSAALQFWPGSH